MDPRLGAGVLLLQHGITVQSLAFGEGPLMLRGWVDVPQLRLNASRSAVIEDEVYEGLVTRLDALLVRLVRQALHEGVKGARLTALQMMVAQKSAVDAFQDEVLFIDALDRKWSARQLKASPKLFWVNEVKHVMDIIQEPLWLDPHSKRLKGAHARPKPEAIAQWGVLRKRFWEQMNDATSLIDVVMEGHRRRRILSQSNHPLKFGPKALMERSFNRDGMSGSVAIASFTTKPGLNTELRVDGLPVEVMLRPYFGNASILARVESEDFTADASFTRIQENALIIRAQEIVVEEAHELLIEAARRIPEHASVQPMLLDMLFDYAERPGPDLDAWAEVVPAPLVDAPLFETFSGARRSLRELLGKKVGSIDSSRRDQPSPRVWGSREVDLY